jgi:hypothetical protein
MPRRPIASLTVLAVAAATGALLEATPAWSQDTAANAVARCRAIADEANRIVCLERALLAQPPEAVSAVAPAEAPPAAAPGPAPAAAEPPLQASATTGGGETAVVSSSSAEAEAFGAQSVANRQRRAGDPDAPEEVIPRMVAAVASVSEFGYRRLQVELDNGQVWRQTGADEPWDFVRNDAPERVEIWPSRLGGYRMAIADTRKVLRVERIE